LAPFGRDNQAGKPLVGRVIALIPSSVRAAGLSLMLVHVTHIGPVDGERRASQCGQWERDVMTAIKGTPRSRGAP